VFSPNHVDYATAIWAAHRLGAIISFVSPITRMYAHSGLLTTPYRPANPSFSVDELVYQLNTTKASLLLVHSSVYKVASEAAKVSGIPADRIVLIGSALPVGVADKTLFTIEQLVNEGAKIPPCFTEKQLRSGEGKTKVAVSRDCSLPSVLWLISCPVLDLLLGYHWSAKGTYYNVYKTYLR